MFKKIHSALTLLLSGIMLLHFVVGGLLMAGIVRMHLWFLLLAYGLLFVMIAHVALTFISMMFNLGGPREKSYTRLNLQYYLQRASAILILVFMPPHFKLFSHTETSFAAKMSGALANPFTPVTPAAPVLMGSLFFLVATVALVVVCSIHTSISIPKALVGLGVIVEEKTLALVEKISFVCFFAAGAFAIWASFMLANASGLFGGI